MTPNLIIFLKQVDTEMRRIGKNTATLTVGGVLKVQYIYVHEDDLWKNSHEFFGLIVV